MKEITKQFGKTVGVFAKDALIAGAFSEGCSIMATGVYALVVRIVCDIIKATPEGRALTYIALGSYLVYITAGACGCFYITDALDMGEKESKELDKLSEMILESKPKNLSAREISVS